MKILFSLLVMLIGLSAGSAYAQQCDQEVSVFNTSKINAILSPHDLWFDGRDGVYEYPAGEGVSALFGGGFWITGFVSDTIRVATQGFQRTLGRDNYEFKEGPSGAADSVYFCDAFIITRSAVDQHLADLRDGQLDNPISEVIMWPGRGNANGPAILMQDDFAPFVDVNGNRIYEPALGDYPKFAGDQAAWWVVNTRDAPGSFSSPWDAELHVFVQAYNTGASDQILKTQFYTATLINRGNVPLDSAALTFMIDPDIGCFTDDAIGSIPDLNLVYAYNYDTLDGTSGNTCNLGVQSYPGKMPVPVTQVLSAKTTLPTLNATHNATYILNRNVSPTPHPQTTVPTTGITIEQYHLAHGRWKDGSPLTRGGSGYRGTEAVNWPFDGEPADPTTWSVCQVGNGHDYRYQLNTNLENALPPNERLTVDYAVYVVDDVALPCPNTDLIRDAANEILSFYQQEVSSTESAFVKTIQSFNVYPNPSLGTVQCVLPKGATMETLQAIDLTGRTVPLTWGQQTGEVTAQLSAKGIFFLIASDTEGNLYRSRIVVE